MRVTVKQLTNETRDLDLADSASVGDLRKATAKAFQTPEEQVVLRLIEAGDATLGPTLKEDGVKLADAKVADGCTISVHILSFTDAAGLG
mmetsp:Transcript_69747/g.130241  ORF Transcript_69747/g.130241 Transcript_69747/m.130241 type:complete len:90 (-) Transcript_69747:76-345(-)